MPSKRCSKRCDKQCITLIAVIALLAVLSGCQASQEKKQTVKELQADEKVQMVSFATDDGFQIKGNYYNAEGSKAVLLLHMLGKDRYDYTSLAEKLQRDGFNVLAIDFRGHGSSTVRNGNEVTYKSFDAESFNSMTLDAAAAKRFLTGKNKSMGAIVGASIGANIALKYAATDSDVRTVVLLSPGENYRGVTISESAQAFERPAYIAASEDDKYSADAARKLNSIMRGKKEMRLIVGRGHGTDMLGEDINAQISAWISGNT